MQSLFTAEELVLDFPEIYGISSSLRHVKFGYSMSNHHDFEVECYHDISVFGSDSVHGAYLLTYKEDGSKCLLIRNKGSKRLFNSKYKQVDYLLCSLSEEEINQEIIHIVRKLKDISLCFVLDKPNQKEIQNYTQLL